MRTRPVNKFIEILYKAFAPSYTYAPKQKYSPSYSSDIRYNYSPSTDYSPYYSSDIRYNYAPHSNLSSKELYAPHNELTSKKLYAPNEKRYYDYSPDYSYDYYKDYEPHYSLKESITDKELWKPQFYVDDSALRFLASYNKSLFEIIKELVR